MQGKSHIYEFTIRSNSGQVKIERMDEVVNLTGPNALLYVKVEFSPAKGEFGSKIMTFIKKFKRGKKILKPNPQNRIEAKNLFENYESMKHFERSGYGYQRNSISDRWPWCNISSLGPPDADLPTKKRSRKKGIWNCSGRNKLNSGEGGVALIRSYQGTSYRKVVLLRKRVFKRRRGMCISSGTFPSHRTSPVAVNALFGNINNIIIQANNESDFNIYLERFSVNEMDFRHLIWLAITAIVTIVCIVILQRRSISGTDHCSPDPIRREEESLVKDVFDKAEDLSDECTERDSTSRMGSSDGIGGELSKSIASEGNEVIPLSECESTSSSPLRTPPMRVQSCDALVCYSRRTPPALPVSSFSCRESRHGIYLSTPVKRGPYLFAPQPVLPLSFPPFSSSASCRGRGGGGGGREAPSADSAQAMEVSPSPSIGSNYPTEASEEEHSSSSISSPLVVTTASLREVPSPSPKVPPFFEIE